MSLFPSTSYLELLCLTNIFSLSLLVLLILVRSLFKSTLKYKRAVSYLTQKYHFKEETINHDQNESILYNTSLQHFVVSLNQISGLTMESMRDENKNIQINNNMLNILSNQEYCQTQEYVDDEKTFFINVDSTIDSFFTCQNQTC